MSYQWSIDDLSMVYRWSIDDLSMIYRWFIYDLPMIEPCFGMNGHPIARMDTILRQCEAPVKIYDSRWFPASKYRFKWSFIAGQGSNIKILKKKSKFWIFFWSFISIQGVQGAIWEGPEPIPELKNITKCSFLKIIKFSIFFFAWGPFLAPGPPAPQNAGGESRLVPSTPAHP